MTCDDHKKKKKKTQTALYFDQKWIIVGIFLKQDHTIVFLLLHLSYRSLICVCLKHHKVSVCFFMWRFTNQLTVNPTLSKQTVRTLSKCLPLWCMSDHA